MKKLILFCLTLLNVYSSQSQVKLTTALVDSLSFRFLDCSPAPFVNARQILNFASLDHQKKSLYFSSTKLGSRKDIPNDVMIYINECSLFFIILKNVDLDSCLQKRLISQNDGRFKIVLDSIKFRNSPYSGVIPDRSPLVVYKIKQRPFCKNSYVITSQSYIPYLSAPEVFIPLKKVSDGYLFTEIEDWYYEGYPKSGKFNKQYYEDMKPIKKIILRMKKR